MIVLGINGLGVMPSAALLVNGKLVAMAEEERFSRTKGAFGAMPKGAVAYCLELAGIGLADIDHIAFGWDCSQYRWQMPLIMAERYLTRSPKNQSGGNGMSAFNQLIKYAPSNVNLCLHQMFIELGMGGQLPKVHFIKHHLAHAASAFYTSGWNKGSVVVVDGSGEDRCTSIFSGEGLTIRQHWSTRIPDSLGWFYQGLTEFLGFEPNSHEGKVMALAAYGAFDAQIASKMERILTIRPNGSYRHDVGYTVAGTHTHGKVFSDAMIDLCGPNRQPNQPLDHAHHNLAFAAQRLLERAMLGIIERVSNMPTFNGHVCLAGGVALNCRMNLEVATHPRVKTMFIPPVTGESGVALGAAMIVSARLGDDPRMLMEHSKWGSEFSDSQIETTLKRACISYCRLTNIPETTSEFLAQGQTVAWFQGRMESGPRALGARSILASPNTVQMRDHVNTNIKKRELWRPFGASILYEDGASMVSSMQDAPFMNMAFHATEKMKKLMPAAVHVDGTTRPQFVKQEVDPLYWNLLHSFKQLTGLPGLLNTSFNRNEEPLVCTPEQALATFFTTGLDHLIIGSYYVSKAGSYPSELGSR